jgi:hypothetical protein
MDLEKLFLKNAVRRNQNEIKEKKFNLCLSTDLSPAVTISPDPGSPPIAGPPYP